MISRCAWALLSLVLTGCIHVPVDEVGPSFESVKLIRAAGFAPIGLGQFSAAPQPGGFARAIEIRGSTLRPPKGGDFPGFLKQTLQSELTAAGRYDPRSTVVVSADMTINRASENLSSGSAEIGAIFAVKRGGRTVFTRTYRAENAWTSNFIGAIAIPEAFRQYNELYGKLVRRVLADRDFVAALSN